MRQVQIAEAKAHLSALIEQVEAGDDNHHAALQIASAPDSEPRTAKTAAEVFREAWSLGGLDLERPLELSLGAAAPD